MGIIAWIVFGFFTGLIARALMPGNQSFGFIKTTLLGIAGSFAGGTIGALVSGARFGTLESAGIIGSVIGAIVLLAIAGMVQRRAA